MGSYRTTEFEVKPMLKEPNKFYSLVPNVDDPDELTAEEEEFFKRFAKLRKDGDIDKILPSKIYAFIKKNMVFFTLGRIPYIYGDGVYRADLDGVVLRDAVRRCIHPMFQSYNGIENIYRMLINATKDLQRKHEELNNYAGEVIPFQNIMFNAKDWTWTECKPEYLCLNQLPHKFCPGEDPDNEPAGGEMIKRFLSEAIPDAADQEMLFQYAGLCCTKDMRQQKMLILTGDGGTGKSTVLSLIQDIVGTDNTSNVPLHIIGQRFQAFGLVGKFLNCCGDLDIDALTNTETMKKVTGEDAAYCEQKGKDGFSFMSTAKMLFSTNELPRIPGETSSGVYRRLMVLEMNHKPKKTDPNLTEKLLKEREWFMWRIMKALHDMYNSEDGLLAESKNSKKAVKRMRTDNDAVQAFIDDMCDVNEKWNPNSAEGSVIEERSELYAAYEKYCRIEERETLGKIKFFRAIQSKGFEAVRSNGSAFFRGIATKETLKRLYLIPRDR